MLDANTSLTMAATNNSSFCGKIDEETESVASISTNNEPEEPSGNNAANNTSGRDTEDEKQEVVGEVGEVEKMNTDQDGAFTISETGTNEPTTSVAEVVNESIDKVSEEENDPYPSADSAATVPSDGIDPPPLVPMKTESSQRPGTVTENSETVPATKKRNTVSNHNSCCIVC